MPASLTEALADQKGQMAAANETGIDVISEFQEIMFTRYVRLVLPLDGFVFWVQAGLTAGQDSTLDGGVLNGGVLNDAATQVQPTSQNTLCIQGSLHYATDARQEEEETYDVNRVVFTAENEVTPLNTVAPDEMWLGTFHNIRFAFTTRSSFYEQAGLWHYTGDAVYADMQSQIVDDISQFSTKQVVSNSLPIWLSMNNFGQNWDAIGLPMYSNSLPLYPSMLSPLNLPPPFATVHIVPEQTTALAAAPTLDSDLTHTQQATDTVRITFWGVRNDDILNFVDFVNNFTQFNTLGIMNMPIVRDEKRTQADLLVLAQKKTIEYKISYNQFTARNVARELILQAVPQFVVDTIDSPT